MITLKQIQELQNDEEIVLVHPTLKNSKREPLTIRIFNEFFKDEKLNTKFYYAGVTVEDNLDIIHNEHFTREGMFNEVVSGVNRALKANTIEEYIYCKRLNRMNLCEGETIEVKWKDKTVLGSVSKFEDTPRDGSVRYQLIMKGGILSKRMYRIYGNTDFSKFNDIEKKLERALEELRYERGE